MTRCILKPGRDLPLRRGHPWVYFGAVQKVEGEGEPGGIVEVLDHRGRFIARGYYNPRSQIAARVLTWRREEIGRGFLRKRLQEAIALRHPLEGRTTAMRLVNSEGDLLPGLIVDRYGDYLALQIHTWGMERLRGTVIDLLRELLKPRGIYDKSDPEARRKEDLPPSEGVLLGQVPDLVEIEEGGLKFLVDIRGGQKTGFYLDQRENRSLVCSLARDRRVLDCFCYTGGFSVAASAGGAKEVRSVDGSARVLELAQENVKLNGLPLERHSFIRADLFDFLREDRGRYDLIILDPPPFARSREEVPQAIRGYVEINLRGLKRLRSGRLLLSCCCSQRVGLEAFKAAVLEASRSAGKTLQLLHLSRAPLDHPVLASHPEGDYFKALLLRVS